MGFESYEVRDDILIEEKTYNKILLSFLSAFSHGAFVVTTGCHTQIHLIVEY